MSFVSYWQIAFGYIGVAVLALPVGLLWAAWGQGLFSLSSLGFRRRDSSVKAGGNAPAPRRDARPAPAAKSTAPRALPG